MHIHEVRCCYPAAVAEQALIRCKRSEETTEITTLQAYTKQASLGAVPAIKHTLNTGDKPGCSDVSRRA